MPELPEVETVCRGLHSRMVGRVLRLVEVRRRDLRQAMPADFAQRVQGRTILRIDRRAKYMQWHLDDQTVVLGHLGMSGSMCIQSEPLPTPKTHDHVRFQLSDGGAVVYNDPRRFGLLLLTTQAQLSKHPLLKKLGPEPLEPSFTAERLRDQLQSRRVPIKAALLDQAVVAGLGNIYVCEALYRAHISPLRVAASLTLAEAKRLQPAIVAILEAAIAAGGSTLRDYVKADGELGYFQHAFAVYDQEDRSCPTPGCKGHIHRLTQAGRSTYYCPRCQK